MRREAEAPPFAHTVPVRVEPRTVLWREGRAHTEGDVLWVSAMEAARLEKSGSAVRTRP